MVHLRIVVAVRRSRRRSSTCSTRPPRPATWSSCGRGATPRRRRDPLRRRPRGRQHRDRRPEGARRPRAAARSRSSRSTRRSPTRRGGRAGGAGLPSDAVVWEEVEARTSETTELGGNFLAFMVLACLIASVGIFTGSPILIIGAMVVGPEFGPLAGALRGDRRAPARRRPALADGARGRLPDRDHRRLPLHPDLRRAPAWSTPTSAASTTRSPSSSPSPDEFSFIVAVLRRRRRDALADLGQVGRPGRRPDLGDDDPGGGQHRRRRGARQLGRLARRDRPARHQPGRDRARRVVTLTSSALSDAGGASATSRPPACRHLEATT